MKMGILGAMLEEIALIKQLMLISNETIIGGRIYYEGTLGNKEVVLTFSRWGKVASSSTVTTLINRFDVDFVVFVGVAGATREELNIGDVVIANSLYQHDMDARPLFDQFQIPLTSTIFFETEDQYILRAKLAAESFFKNMHLTLRDDLLTKYFISHPKVHSGIIASGDKFVTNALEYENLKLKKEGKETLAVEMEGAAIAQVCFEYGIPFIVIRTISDKANHSAVFDFQSFISEVASYYSCGIIKEFLAF